MKKTKQQKENRPQEDFSFGKASIMTICVLFFLSIVFIGVCFLSQSTTEKYAQIKVAEARGVSEQKLALAETNVGQKLNGVIVIGEGVIMSDGCDVAKTAITCY